jgi:HK97 gp10 family phage protein
MAAEIEGLDKVLERFEVLSDTTGIAGAMGKACALVERTAKQTAPKDTGALRNSIKSEVVRQGESVVGIVSTPLEYAPYVEFGTGLFAEEGGRKTPWMYEDEKTGDTIFTRGQKPQPFLRPALNENRERITQILKEGMND